MRCFEVEIIIFACSYHINFNHDATPRWRPTLTFIPYTVAKKSKRSIETEMFESIKIYESNVIDFMTAVVWWLWNFCPVENGDIERVRVKIYLDILVWTGWLGFEEPNYQRLSSNRFLTFAHWNGRSPTRWSIGDEWGSMRDTKSAHYRYGTASTSFTHL